MRLRQVQVKRAHCRGISNFGQVVGVAGADGYQRSFLWQDGR